MNRRWGECAKNTRFRSISGLMLTILDFDPWREEEVAGSMTHRENLPPAV
jgi:hypothetical protein